MKCPECKASRKYKDGMKCVCGYRFSLDPKKDYYTDGKFLGDISKASQKNTEYFTENQLYAAFCGRTSSWSWLAASIVAAVIIGFVGVMFGPPAALAALGILGVIGAIIALARRARRPPTRDRFRKLLERYEDVHGPVRLMLTKPALHTPPPEWSEPDIYDYGVERLLVVQHELMVDLFVRNGFHTENRTLVLTGGGYPDYLVQPACKALNDNPNLPVFFLHDADPIGQLWAHKLMDDASVVPWANHSKIDLGLNPDDVAKIKRLRPQRPDLNHNYMPVDALPYSMLAIGLTGALEQKTSLTQLLAMRQDQSGGDAGGSFG